MPIKSLQQLAYQNIPPAQYRDIMSNPNMSTEREVLQYVKSTLNHRTFKNWASTVKMPNKYIRQYLVLLNSYTKPDYFNAINYVKTKNRKYDFKVVSDYFDEIAQILDDKILFNDQINEHETNDIWNRLVYPNILHKTFLCLCYRRLKNISYIDKEDVYYSDEYDEYMNGELFEKICNLPDNDKLPLMIYLMISAFYENKKK